MKKILSIMLILIIVFSMSTAAFAADFDLSVLEKSDLYSRNSFDKSWSIEGTCYPGGLDLLFASSTFGMYLQMDSKSDAPMLLLTYVDDMSLLQNKGNYKQVSSFQAIVDDTLYSFTPSVYIYSDCGYIEAGNIAREFVNSLAGAEKIAFQYTVKGSSSPKTIDPVKKSDLTQIIKVASLLEESNAWSICSDLEKNDKSYGASKQAW